MRRTILILLVSVITQGAYAQINYGTDSATCVTKYQIYRNDYKIGDFIKIINNRNHNLDELLSYPLKIKRIKENIIVCDSNDYCDYENKVLTNIDMKLMNTSNQNIIYFNL